MPQQGSNGRTSSSRTRSRTATGRRNAPRVTNHARTGRPRSSSTRGRTNTSRVSKRSSRQSSKAAGAAETVKRSMKEGADKVSRASKGSKVPMLVGGAGTLVGLAGGIALGTRRAGKRRMPRVDGDAVKKAAAAARQLGLASQRLGEMATEIQRAGKEPQSSARRSPLEIVLEGLTTRRVPS